MSTTKKYIVSEGYKPQKAILFTEKKVWTAPTFIWVFLFFLFLCILASAIYYFIFGNPLVYPSNEPFYVICLSVIALTLGVVYQLRTAMVSVKVDEHYLYTTKKQKILLSCIDSVEIKAFEQGYSVYVRCGDKIVYLMNPSDKNLAQVIQEKLKIWVRHITP